MRRVPDQLTSIIEPIVVELGYECVGIEYSPHPKNGFLRVFIDCDGGVQLDDCSKVSHQLSGALDVEDPICGNYQLEISSPGLDRPLFKLEDFGRFAGNPARIQLVEPVNERRKFTGLLRGINNTNVLVEVDDDLLEFPFQLVLKARLVPEHQVAK